MWRTEKDSIWNWETHPKFPNKRDKHVPLVATPIDISGHEATPKIRMATIAKRYLGADQRRAKYVTVTARWLDGSSYCTVLVSHISSLLILLLVWLCLACLRIFLCSKKMPHLWGQYPIFLSQAHYIPSAPHGLPKPAEIGVSSVLCKVKLQAPPNFLIFSHGWLKIMPPKKKKSGCLILIHYSSLQVSHKIPCHARNWCTSIPSTSSPSDLAFRCRGGSNPSAKKWKVCHKTQQDKHGGDHAYFGSTSTLTAGQSWSEISQPDFEAAIDASRGYQAI